MTHLSMVCLGCKKLKSIAQLTALELKGSQTLSPARVLTHHRSCPCPWADRGGSGPGAALLPCPPQAPAGS